MPQSQWQDTSSYSQRETEHVPWKFKLNLGDLNLLVHRHRDYPADMWLATCYGAFEHRQLKAKDIEAAQREAVKILREWLNNAIGQLPT